MEDREQEAVCNMKLGCIRYLCVCMVGRMGRGGEKGRKEGRGFDREEDEQKKVKEREPAPMLFL